MNRARVRVLAFATCLSTLAMCVFLYLFVVRNGPGFSALAWIIFLALLYGLLYVAASLFLVRALLAPAASSSAAQRMLPLRLALLVVAAVLLYVFIDSTVIDYYQPLSLYDDVIGALALAWGALITVALALGLQSSPSDARLPGRTLLLCLVALTGWPLAASLYWINTPHVGEQVILHRDVFVGGVDGYDVYRIPGFVVIPGNTALASGETLQSDRLLAFAEARRDGALDTGVIDLVLKTSADGGSTWSAQRRICRYAAHGQRGKCGNPTPLFDAQTGRVFLAYNLSGIHTGETGGVHHSAHIMHSDDGGRSWSEPVQIADDNLVFGPGHGMQKKLSPNAGRLLIPAYVKTHALVVYSDDHGQSWQRGEGLDTGNETDVAELSSGALYMTTRHRAPIGRPPHPNGRLYSVSQDGGATWPDAKTDTSLSTPVCQAAVLRYGNEQGLLFANPSHHTSRVQMTLQHSRDDGSSWGERVMIYPGPAGYSVVASANNGDVLILYERGNMSYSERISLARVESLQLRR